MRTVTLFGATSAIVGLSLCAVGQGIVPTSLNGVEGGGGTSIPFGSSLACRYQCIYDAVELPWTGPRVLTGVRIRPDLNNGGLTPAKGFIEVSVLVSTTTKTAATVSDTFEDNYGSDALWVIQNRIMQLPQQPSLPAGATGPRPANIDLAFDEAWAYGLTPVTSGQPAADSLLIEIWIHNQPSGAYRVDNLSNCVAPTSTFGSVGPACTANGTDAVQIVGDQSMLAGNDYTWTVTNAEPSVPFFLSASLTNVGGVFGIPAFPLPYPMFDPADPTQPSPLLQVFGQSAPDCYLNVSPDVFLGAITDPSGTGTITLPLPAGPFTGVTYYAQAICFSPTANPLRLITSLGRSTTICGPLNVARVFQFYNGLASPPVPVPSAGTISYGVGMVLDFF